MYSLKKIFFPLFTLVFGINAITAQNGISKGGESLPITTSVPFLRITPDARAGAMGDAGIAISPDVNAVFHNASKLVFAKDPYGASLSYVPWLRSLVNDIYLLQAAGYGKFGKKQNQAVGGSIRYFSLGQIQFTDISGASLGDFKPNEFAIDVAYSRLLGKGFSSGIGLRYIYSNLAGGQSLTSGTDIQPGNAVSADISFYYEKDISIKKVKGSQFAAGLNLSNLGSKITYTNSAERDFIPMNMGIGTRFTVDIDEFNQISVSLDFNKLLVPTPDLDTSSNDSDNNGIPDFREKSVPSAIFSSFSDAPGGFSEEIKEFTVGAGFEYWYDQLFAVRAGYFYESPEKGRRQFLSLGVGLRYSVFGIDFAYLVPTTSERNPLDNTLRFSLIFNLTKAKQKQEATPVTNEPPFSN